MSDTNRSWYSVKVRVGKEDKAISAIKVAAEIRKLQGYIGEMFTAKVTKQLKDKKITTNLYPGYIFINAEINNEVKHMVASAANVLSFVGDKRNPAVISAPEIEKIYSSINVGQSSLVKKVQNLISEGDRVRLLTLNNVSGLVKKVDENSGRITVSTDLLGRTIDTVVLMDQVERI